ncbi:MAG: ABC transporter permease, partial [Turicibacter sp.]
GRGFWQLVFAMCITGWLGIAYFIRTQVMIIRDREYNLASKCLGTPKMRMVTKNVLPFQLSVIMTIISREIPSAISTEVFLSYLGIGLGVDVPSLGRMISKYANYFNGYPHLFWAPVLVLALISVSLYVIGQKLADAADPRTHM